MHELNATLFQTREVLVVQIHSHPGDAYHSETDDAYPIVTALGGISIVVADFCKHGIIDKSSALYRLTKEGWVRSTTLIHDVIETI